MKQKELAITSGMPEARISRILHDGKVKLTEKDINQLAIGLQMSVEERNQLRYIAWPELSAIDKVLMSSEIKNITEANILLASEGLPLLGNDFLE